MSRHREPDPEFLTPPLADAVDAVRAERLDSEAVRRAADRVWRRLADEADEARRNATPADPAAAIAGCAGFQAQIPAYLAGTLAPERKLLLEDHSRECVPCRRALNAARRGEQPAPVPAAVESATAHAGAQAGGRRFPRRWLAAAAALLATVGIAGWLARAPRGPAAVVESADGGALLRVASGGVVTPLAEGAELAAGETVRTARGAAAVVRLADGSAVELAGGTELAVARGRRDTTVRLDRGLVIVEAAKRGRGHLYVSTDDCRVAVTGTIFAVNHGVKGSRVSVIEGEVRVASGQGGVDVLRPGEQVTTRASLTAVPVAEEVAWSRHHDRYVDLLRELEALSRAIEERVERPGLRYQSALADLAPAEAVAYIGMPNLSGQVAEGYTVFREQLATSPVLAAWWAQQNDADGEAEPHLDLVVTFLSDFGAYLGDEVAVAFLPEGSALDGGGPVILAEIVRPGFAAYLDEEAAHLEAEAGHPVLVPVADPHAAPAAGDGLLVWPGDGLMIAAPNPALLAAAADAAAGAAPALPGTPLYDRVTAAYAGGVEWLFVGDFGGLIEEAGGSATAAAERERLGFADLEHVVVEHHGLEGSGLGGRAQTTAVVSFGGPRRGVASWLAEPAPMGALDYVSPDASAAFAAVLKEPAAMFDDLLSGALAGDPEAREHLDEARRELGFDLRDDLAAALGGEIAFAVDGPLVPEPSWLLIAEVDDPARLQASLEALVVHVAEQASQYDEAGEVTLEAGEPIGGVPAWRLSGGSFVEVHYLYNGGYLVAAPSRALLSRALDQRAAGASLASSARFRELVPADGHADFSALFYQHLGPALAPLIGAAGSFSGEMSAEQRQALAELSAESEPTLAVAYGEPRAIRFAATSRHGAFGLGYRALLGMSSLHALAGEAASAEAH
jgi:hypothetical protein